VQRLEAARQAGRHKAVSRLIRHTAGRGSRRLAAESAGERDWERCICLGVRLRK
jgi:hypothetical protein